MEGQVDAYLGSLIRRCQNFVLRIKKKDESSNFVLWYLVILLLTLCATHYSHQRQYEKKNNSQCCADSHCLHMSSPPIVFTSHPPELSLQTHSVILVMWQLVNMSQFIDTKVNFPNLKMQTDPNF